MSVAASSRRRVRTDSEGSNAGPARSAKQSRLADGGFWALARLPSSLYVVLSKASPCEAVQRVNVEPACHDSSLLVALDDFPSLFRACPPVDAIPRLVAFALSYHPSIAKHYLTIVPELRFSATEPPYPFLQVNEYHKIIRTLQRVGHFAGPADVTTQSVHEAIGPIRIGFQRLVDGCEKYRASLVAADRAIRAAGNSTVLRGAPSFLTAHCASASSASSLGGKVSAVSSSLVLGTVEFSPCAPRPHADEVHRPASPISTADAVPPPDFVAPAPVHTSASRTVPGDGSSADSPDVICLPWTPRPALALGAAESPRSAPDLSVCLPDVICLPWNPRVFAVPPVLKTTPLTAAPLAPSDARDPQPVPIVPCVSNAGDEVDDVIACSASQPHPTPSLVDSGDVDLIPASAKWIAAAVPGPGFPPPPGRQFKAGLVEMMSSEDPTLHCTAGQLVLVDPLLLMNGEGRVHFDARYLLPSKLQPCPVAIFVAGHEIGASATTVELTPFRPLYDSLITVTRKDLREIGIAEDECRGTPRVRALDRVQLVPLTTYRVTSRALLGIMRWCPWASAEATWCLRWLRAPRRAAEPTSALPCVDYAAPCIVAIAERDWVVVLSQGRMLRRVMLLENAPASPLPSRWRPRLAAPIDAFGHCTTTSAEMRIRFTAPQVSTRQVYMQSCSLLEWAVTVNTLCAAAPFLPSPPLSAPTPGMRRGAPPTALAPVIVHVPAAPLPPPHPAPAGASADAVLHLTAKAARAEGMLQGQGAALHVYRLAATDVKQHEYARWQMDAMTQPVPRPQVPHFAATSPVDALADELLLCGLEKVHILRIAEALVAEDVTSLVQLRQLSPDVVMRTCCPEQSWSTLGKALARQKFEIWLKEIN